jgi:SNF2 family DNA or RNA helicase
MLMPGWSPAMDRQAICRAVRGGQEHEVQVYRLLAKKSIEEYVERISLEKSVKAAGILDPRNLDSRLVKQIQSWGLDEFKAQVSRDTTYS